MMLTSFQATLLPGKPNTTPFALHMNFRIKLYTGLDITAPMGTCQIFSEANSSETWVIDGVAYRTNSLNTCFVISDYYRYGLW